MRTTWIECGIRLSVVLIAIGAANAGPAQSEEIYNPQIKPAEFSTDITRNPYFSLPVGSRFVYESETEDGLERIEIMIPGWTKTVMGVETLVFWDRVFIDDELIEDTRDYLAQHENGDVWYFGEDVDNYEDGKLVDHEGAWIGGVDGALPGIWMKGNPKVGDEYRQEFYLGKAEDAAKIIKVSGTVQSRLGELTDCVTVFEWSPLFPDTAHKIYCAETGVTTAEIDLVGPGNDAEVRADLIDIDPTGAIGIAPPTKYVDEGVIAAN